LVWDRTIAPLARWCAHPTRRERDPDALDLRAFVPTTPEDSPAPTGVSPDELQAAQAEAATWRALAEEREAYAHRVEAAWRELGATLAERDAARAGWERAPWRTAFRQTMTKWKMEN
jgi:hypothetical protein